MRILARPEWSQQQREFLRGNPKLAIKIEAYLNHLDSTISYLEERQRKNPIWRIKNFFRSLIEQK